MSHHKATSTSPYGMGKKTLKFYVIGFLLSLLFTIVSFGVVARDTLPPVYIFSLISVLAILQFIAQVIFFLRLKASGGGLWNLMPFLFTILIVFVLVFGSLWIMYNLNYNMMH